MSSQTLARVAALGLKLPAPMKLPHGVVLPFPWVRRVDDRIFVSGHGPLDDDGFLARPVGKVGSDVSVEQANRAAAAIALAMIASLAEADIDLDRVQWLRVFGMVHAVPDFDAHPAVINGFTDTIVAVFGPDRGAHARSAVGMHSLPFNVPVEIEAELLLR